MSADPGKAPTGTSTPAAPVSGRTALAVLGSMVFLIIALTFLLVQTTWVHPVNAADAAPAVYHSELGSR